MVIWTTVNQSHAIQSVMNLKRARSTGEVWSDVTTIVDATRVASEDITSIKYFRS
jgi:hypothetical protein